MAKNIPEDENLWQGAHDDAPTDEHARPIHPERGYIICAQPKTDATPKNNDRKRDDISYCLSYAGSGTDRPTEYGGACAKHGGGGGAPTGWQNGNARHLMFSKRMNDDDREQFKQLVDVGDDDSDKIPVDEFRATLGNIIAWEEMRFSRALDAHPDVAQIAIYECPSCGESYRREVTVAVDQSVDECGGTKQIDADTFVPCDYTGTLERVAGKSWVDFGDESVERKASHIARLIKIYDEISGPSKHEIHQDTTIHGGDDPLDVNIRTVGVDLDDPEFPDVVDPARDEDD